MPETILVALGGNALITPGQPPSIEGQREVLRHALGGVVDLIARGYRVVLTHGNGPQVGHILLRSEAGRQEEAYDLPLDVCVAQSQGETGYLIAQVLEEILRRRAMAERPVVAVMTRTVVERTDPQMQTPTKPIGPFYTREQARELKTRGWRLVEAGPRGWRRVVPSPVPVRVLESASIRRLVESGAIVVAVGGGGIPVGLSAEGRWTGIEAVVDKDLASTLLAIDLLATTILNLTDVDHAKLHFGSPNERDLDRVTTMEARRYLAEGHFAPGSMGPKIQAAIDFLGQGGQAVVVTRPERVVAGFDGLTGTQLRESFEEAAALKNDAICSGTP
ncbi:MAG: carbamate kinase [Nitrospirae bacterium]|nr:carbamate kinase [Nitrospirota bacterium]